MQNFGLTSRARLGIASALALGLLGGGVAISQFAAADQVMPGAPVATTGIDAPTPSLDPSVLAEKIERQIPELDRLGTASTPSATPSVSPDPAWLDALPTPGQLLDPTKENLKLCEMGDDEILAAVPDVEVRVEGGEKRYLDRDGRLVGATRDGKGWGPPCSAT